MCIVCCCPWSGYTVRTTLLLMLATNKSIKKHGPRLRVPWETQLQYMSRIRRYFRHNAAQVAGPAGNWKVAATVDEITPEAQVLNNIATRINDNWQGLPELADLQQPSKALRDENGVKPDATQFRNNPARYIIAFLNRVVCRLIQHKWDADMKRLGAWPVGYSGWGLAALAFKYVPTIGPLNTVYAFPPRLVEGLCIPCERNKSFKRIRTRHRRHNVTENYDGYLSVHLGKLLCAVLTSMLSKPGYANKPCICTDA